MLRRRVIQKYFFRIARRGKKMGRLTQLIAAHEVAEFCPLEEESSPTDCELAPVFPGRQNGDGRSPVRR